MFDPFEDFAEKGYLRNKQGERDLRVVKEVEHALFVVHLPEAQQFLSTRKRIQYAEALRVHEILLSELYPWAGQDRRKVAPNIAVRKGEVMFAHPAAAQRAVEWALESGRNQAHMRAHPGEVMGHLAFGHPFLDGNGRTLLLVHSGSAAAPASRSIGHERRKPTILRRSQRRSSHRAKTCWMLI